MNEIKTINKMISWIQKIHTKFQSVLFAITLMESIAINLYNVGYQCNIMMSVYIVYV